MYVFVQSKSKLFIYNAITICKQTGYPKISLFIIAQVEFGEVALRWHLDVVLLQHSYVVSGCLPGFARWKCFYNGSDNMSAVMCRRVLDCVFL